MEAVYHSRYSFMEGFKEQNVDKTQILPHECLICDLLNLQVFFNLITALETETIKKIMLS